MLTLTIKTFREVWRVITNHVSDCYFCMVPLLRKGINTKKKNNTQYHDTPFIVHPITDSEGLPVPVPLQVPPSSSDRNNSKPTHTVQPKTCHHQPVRFTPQFNQHHRLQNHTKLYSVKSVI